MSRKLIYAILGFALALTLGMIVPTARATDDWDQTTKFTFNQPVDIPGNVVLDAGTYWFVVPLGPGVQPNIVRIYNADRTKVMATLETIPVDRPEATSHSSLTFGEQSKGQPVALLDWFFPGRLTGHEFIYSPSKEAEMAQTEQIRVMARPSAQG